MKVAVTNEKYNPNRQKNYIINLCKDLDPV